MRQLLDNSAVLVKLQFIADIAPLFTEFLELFQRRGPMVHVLHMALCDLMTKLMLRFLKTDVLSKKTGDQLCEIEVDNVQNMRNLEEMEICEATKNAMSTNIKKEKHKAMLMEMRSFFLSSVKHLQTKLPLRNQILKALECLKPSARLSAESETEITRLAKAVPHVVSAVEISSVCDEWKLYALDDITLQHDTNAVYSTGEVHLEN